MAEIEKSKPLEEQGSKKSKVKKNKIIPLIVLIGVVVLLIATFFILKKLDLNAPPKEESTVTAMHSKSSETLESFSFTDKEGEFLTFVKDKGVWYVESDMVFPVDQTKVNDMTATLVGTLLATRTIESDNGEYGFDNPRNVVSAKYNENGTVSEVKYTIGISNEFNSGTYVRDDVNNKIYLCASDPAKNFDVAKNDLIMLDIAAADVEVMSTSKVTIINENGEKREIVSDMLIEEVLDTPFSNVDCGDWVEYACDDADMAKYGITKNEDKPLVSVFYKTTVSVKDENGVSTPTRQDTTYYIWFGNTTDDGSIYYTITGSSIVYKLSADKYELLMSYMFGEGIPNGGKIYSVSLTDGEGNSNTITDESEVKSFKNNFYNIINRENNVKHNCTDEELKPFFDSTMKIVLNYKTPILDEEGEETDEFEEGTYTVYFRDNNGTIEFVTPGSKTICKLDKDKFETLFASVTSKTE